MPTIVKMTCPTCRGVLRRGRRRFGPASVTCGHCGASVATGLADWSKKSSAAKAGAVLLEIIVPSFLRGRDFASLALLTFTHWVFLMLLGMGPAIMIATGKHDIGFAVFVLVYPTLFTFWLVEMIVQSRRFAESGRTPKWTSM